MTRFDSISTLNGSRCNWKIKVRVIRIWDTYIPPMKQFRGSNLILLDDNHSRIHAFIYSSNVGNLARQFEEGNVYIIQNFYVKDYIQTAIRCLPNDKQITLTDNTRVTQIDDDGLIEQNVFDLYDLSDAARLKKDDLFLIDIVGVVTDVQPLYHFTNRHDQDQCKIKFKITDGSSCIEIIFWDQLAEEFDKRRNQVPTQPPIIIIASIGVNRNSDTYNLSSHASTRFYLNHDHYSVQQLRSRVESTTFYSEQEQEEDAHFEHPAKLIDLRTDMPDFTTITCHLTVQKVEENNGWFYHVCTSCQEEVTLENLKYTCQRCARNIPFPDKRFRICALVSDDTANAALIIHDREEGDITIFPKELLIMEGRKYKVTIALKEENITKSSTMYTASDIDMVEAGLDKSAQQQSSPNQAQDNSNVVEATKRTLSPVTNTRVKTSKGKKANNKRKGRKLLLVVSDDEEDNKPSTKLKLPKKEKVL
ncbi:hypothetical protein POM88_028423 [Heracleum sosnowskyi]|uniref:Replication protein A subunit n=1 Tax=Heracleum sosnowskyi TaxID=360622 RepID=A0AAD8HRW1_9APIA|nr:hypothetical protein POM88_028423 [Heracleum sosnowskyi]